MTLKGIFGITLLIIYGFAVFITCASVGFVGTQLLILMPWWKILLGTLLGTIAVVLHYIVKWEMEDKKKDEQTKIQ